MVEILETHAAYSIPLTAGFSVPLNYLQIVAEEMQFSGLLDAAAASTDPLVQMAHVVAFDAAFHSFHYKRRSLPLSPLLGETYEMDRTSDLGWRFMSEHIQHLPPVILSVGVVLSFVLYCACLGY